MASIVQEWDRTPLSPFSPPNKQPTNGLRESRTSSLQRTVRQAAVDNGIQRPRGYNVSFHYNSDVEQHHFGSHHPMKPWRLHLTKELILSYGLHYAMDLYQTREATRAELATFHTDEYIDFLSEVTPDNMNEMGITDKETRHNFGDDCPVFDGLYRYCTLYTGASVSAARTLAATNPPFTNSHDIAINWSGGLHHAKKSEASGFCYINDIVLCILELLRTHPRVLYIDIDVHHGDGVEQAFASSDRVMTLSYHKYDKYDFFPGTGGLHETGPKATSSNPGAYTSLNVPLLDGIEDDQYTYLFEQITGKTIEVFRPTAIVLQCGADSLGGDRLGKFNLNIKAHGACLSFVQSHRLPLLVLGGGGYTARNVARLWTHETSLCTGSVLPDAIPAAAPYRQAFAGAENGDSLLYPNLEGRHENKHDREKIEGLVQTCHEHLRHLQGAPSVMMRRIPREVWGVREEVDAVLKEEEAERESGRRDLERSVGERGGY
ncbi:hypothetical protein FH972_022681 [Carpinus fangiana]|uniref:Histone deacetylase n=1 Tax=Carpinus fangiana TaxID=176857 RepID=A0A5N6KSY7_9ROSI|nr:hypothetical protein FH972_022681 [Carpinus fangiana]